MRDVEKGKRGRGKHKSGGGEIEEEREVNSERIGEKRERERWGRERKGERGRMRESTFERGGEREG